LTKNEPGFQVASSEPFKAKLSLSFQRMRMLLAGRPFPFEPEAFGDFRIFELFNTFAT